MLFNSVEFLAFFLPQVFIGFLLLRHWSGPVLGWLALASLVFYAWWEPAYLLLLLGSASFNFLLARLMDARRGRSSGRSWLILGVIANLALLGFYKYAGFAVDTLAHLAGLQLDSPSLVLPLAISFFTLQQIAYLVDVYQGQRAETQPLIYLLFVCFFPQLIAGPIVHHRQVVPQFRRIREPGEQRLLAPAVVLIVLGLAKKVLVADNLALLATPGYASEAIGQLAALDAWVCMLAYTLQLYFDFSGYCDIALGLALLFGIRLPVNFLSPLKADSIIEFWHRWHMTLSGFLRDYVYIPLGGNRRGQARRGLNLMLTMLVGGLWHGAGWNFVLWGGMHGFFLLINHGFRRVIPAGRGVARVFLGRVITFMAVAVAFVYFRAPSLEVGNHLLIALPGDVSGGFSSYYLGQIHSSFQFELLGLAAGALGGTAFCLLLLLLTLALAQMAPNALEIVNSEKVGFEGVLPASRLHFSPNLWWSLFLATTLWLVVLSLTRVSPFLYFQF